MGGCALGALKKWCAKRWKRKQENAAKQHLPSSKKGTLLHVEKIALKTVGVGEGPNYFQKSTEIRVPGGTRSEVAVPKGHAKFTAKRAREQPGVQTRCRSRRCVFFPRSSGTSDAALRYRTYAPFLRSRLGYFLGGKRGMEVGKLICNLPLEQMKYESMEPIYEKDHLTTLTAEASFSHSPGFSNGRISCQSHLFRLYQRNPSSQYRLV